MRRYAPDLAGAAPDLHQVEDVDAHAVLPVVVGDLADAGRADDLVEVRLQLGRVADGQLSPALQRDESVVGDGADDTALGDQAFDAADGVVVPDEVRLDEYAVARADEAPQRVPGRLPEVLPVQAHAEQQLPDRPVDAVARAQVLEGVLGIMLGRVERRLAAVVQRLVLRNGDDHGAHRRPAMLANAGLSTCF